MYPADVARLQELEYHISGGCTAVVAVITNNRLYVANVGDSRAILAYEERDGSLQVKQLSEDHGVENEQELQQLTALGLDREQLKKSGRLGTQENTRSIGDYIHKGAIKMWMSSGIKLALCVILFLEILFCFWKLANLHDDIFQM